MPPVVNSRKCSVAAVTRRGALPDERFVIAVGCYVKSLTELAIQVGEKIGPVMCDLRNNDCQTPLAPDYIRKVQQRGTIGKKRKTVKC